MKKEAASHNMTEGKIFKPLLIFTIPLVLGNLVQLMYNAADSVIVGRLVGAQALAAVGTSTPIMNLAILLISGMCMGASVLISTEYGAEDMEGLKRQISTTLIFGIAFCAVFSLAMLFFSRTALRLIQVPEEVIPKASSYLRIIFLGLIFTFIYNFLANTMRVLGDSRTPLYFLIISAVLNVFGDILFVGAFKWGVTGSAVSTVICEGRSCALCMLYIRKNIPLLNMGRKWLVFDRKLLKKTVSFGSIGAMQQVALQFGKILIQSFVNTQGVSVIAAFAAVNRVDDFAYTPQQNIAHAMTTFIAQNHGAGKDERIRKGFKTGLLIECMYSFALFFVIFFGADRIMGLFVKERDAEVIMYGVGYLKLIAIMYILPGVTNGLQGFFRGIGDLKVTLFSTSVNMIGRVIAVYIMLNLYKLEFSALAWANMAGWICMLIFELPLLIKKIRNNK